MREGREGGRERGGIGLSDDAQQSRIKIGSEFPAKTAAHPEMGARVVRWPSAIRREKG